MRVPPSQGRVKPLVRRHASGERADRPLGCRHGPNAWERRMAVIPMYHQGSRQLQDRYSTRRLADRLSEVLARNAFTAEDRAQSCPLFFLATADADGRPDCSHKGGCRDLCRWWGRTAWPFPTTMATACLKASVTCLPIQPSESCSSISRVRAGCA